MKIRCRGFTGVLTSMRLVMRNMGGDCLYEMTMDVDGASCKAEFYGVSSKEIEVIKEEENEGKET